MKAITSLGSTSLVATAVLRSACASTPPRSAEIEQARTEIQALAADPMAQSAAEDLQAAQDRLHEAESALEQRQPPDVVDHRAYLARRHAEAGEARVREAHARAEVARAQDERNRVLLAKREAETERARSQAQSAQEQVHSTQEQLAEAQRQLAELKAQSTDRGMVVTLGDVLFDTGQATLKPGADLSLDRLARYLTSHPGTKVRVEGHTDSRGSADYNQALSERRAEAVAHALIFRGVSPDAVEAIGRGKEYPVATNDTQAGRQQNRRVEIVFSSASGQFAQGESEGVIQR